MNTKPSSNLKPRLISAFVLGPVILGVIFLGDLPFILTIAAIALAGLYEWARMVWFGHKAGKEKAVAAGALLLFGIFYICLSAGMMIWLRTVSPHGLFNMLTLMLIVWASDASAYFSGKALGGPKLAPSISPNKTWAGFLGSSVGAAIVAAGLACPWTLGLLEAETAHGFSWPAYAGLGFVLAMFGQVGDLFISIFKRRYGIKDTGALIPGHGGVLDRVDALLLVAILFSAWVMLSV